VCTGFFVRSPEFDVRQHREQASHYALEGFTKIWNLIYFPLCLPATAVPASLSCISQHQGM
jgi:hypothetical protein